MALDPDRLVPGAPRACWSPVAGCERSETAERRAAAFMAAAGDDNDGRDGAFFRDSARDLLKAYLHAAALAGLDIRAVLEWSRRPEDPTAAEVLLGSADAAPGWGDLVDLHTTGVRQTTSGVLRYVSRALACLAHRSVVADCCPPPGQGLDIPALLEANGTLYLMGKASRLGGDRAPADRGWPMRSSTAPSAWRRRRRRDASTRRCWACSMRRPTSPPYPACPRWSLTVGGGG